MEMASAHGLALKLVEMNRLDRINRNELCEIISEEDKIIKLWYIACQSEFSKKDFFTLVRKTIVYVLGATNSLKEQKRKELLKGVSTYFNKFSNIRNILDIRKPFIDVIVDPWKNTYFSWEELFQKRINVGDINVQRYFEAEPEEIVLARVHLFSKHGKDDMSMVMSKNSFLYHFRIIKTFKYLSKSSKTVLNNNTSRKGIPSLDWYIYNLRKKKNLNSLCAELNHLTCDEGVLLIMRLRGLKYLSFALSVVEIFIMRDLVHSSKFCCTKKLFMLWALLYHDLETPMDQVNEDIRKLVAVYAPTSSHFYLLVDAFWEQFGMKFVNVYVELYIRGLTTDLNLLEAAKHQNKHEDVDYLESHMSSMFYKLSTLFSDSHQRVARECMFSAFSLRPTKKILYILQSMTHEILSDESETKCDSSFNHSNVSVQECKCTVKCTGFCKNIKEHVLDHPILIKGIPNIPYIVVRDLVSVLESVRCFHFQYNVFDWHKNAIDLGDYLRDFTLCKSYESDTECEEESAPVAGPKSQSETIGAVQLQPALKRKSNSCDLKETFPFEVGGSSIEVGNEELINKRMRMEDKSKNVTSDTKEISNATTQEYINHRMEDAIEKVIRKTLDDRKKISSEFNHFNNGSKNVSSLYKPVSENHVYPYSLTDNAKGTNLNTEIENPLMYNYNPAHSRMLPSPPVNRGSVISPTLHSQKSSSGMQEHSSRQINQNKHLLKSVSDSYYSKSKEIQTDTGKKLPVYQQQEAHNFASKSSPYEQNKILSKALTQSSRYISNQISMQMAHRSSIPSNFSKEQFLSNIPIRSTSSVTSPLNLSQPKMSAVQSPQYLPVAAHRATNPSSIVRTDPRYQMASTVSKTFVKRDNESMGFQDNQLVPCDRRSVIKHTTMQYVKEHNSQVQLMDDVPNVNDAVKQIREDQNKNLPPFKVNIPNSMVPTVALAELYVNRKAQPQLQPAENPSQTVVSSAPPTSSDVIKIPGILAAPSVIVSPYISRGEMVYKKNTQSSTLSTIGKKTYKRIPYGRSTLFKTELLEPKFAYDKNNNSQVFKEMASRSSPNVHTITTSYQSNTNASQNQTALTKSSSQEVIQTTSSQPWYSEPYPKPPGSRNISSTSPGHSVEKNTIKIFQPGNEAKSFAMYSKQIHQSKNETTAISSLSHSTNNIVLDSSKKPVVHYATTYSRSNTSASVVPNSSVLNKSNVASSSSSYVSVANTNIYSPAAHTSVTSTASQLCDRSQLDSELTLNKNSIPYSVSSIIDNSLQFSQTSSKSLQNSCCSPSELNPCQNCSLPSESNLIQASGEKTLNNQPNNMISRHGKMILENDSSVCNATFPATNEEKCSNGNQLSCPNCASLFSEIELQNHILNCASRSLDINDSGVMGEIDPSMFVTDNFCAKPLPDVVPEQHHSFFQKEQYLYNLPQTTKSFINMEDNKNLDEIDANDFNMYMNLISGDDKDFGGMVQGDPMDNDCLVSMQNDSMVPTDNNSMVPIDNNSMVSMDNNSMVPVDNSSLLPMDNNSLLPMDNNYLPYPQSANVSDEYLSNNLYTDIQDNGNPLLNSASYGEINEINSYNIDNDCPDLQEKKLSVYDFTDSKSVQPPVLTKPPISFTETGQTNAKMSNDLFVDFVKFGIMNETSPNEPESDNHYQYKTDASDEFQSSGMCLKLESEENAYASESMPIDLIPSVDQTNLSHASKNTVQRIRFSEEAKTQEKKIGFKCLYCLKVYRGSISNLKKHTSTVHKNLPVQFLKVPCIILPKKEVKSKFCKSESVDTFKDPLQFDMKDKVSISNVLENINTLPKGRIKGIIKNPQTMCTVCNKPITMMYFKKHMLRQHSIKVENSSNLDTNVNESPTVDSKSPLDSINLPSVSPLLEQDFDSSTCLSASDALKKNNSFIVNETTHNSGNNGKLAKKTVKFDFNVLEFDKEAESDSKAFRENQSLQTESHSLENLQNFEGNSDEPYKKPAKCYGQKRETSSKDHILQTENHLFQSGQNVENNTYNNESCKKSSQNRKTFKENNLQIENNSLENVQNFEEDIFNNEPHKKPGKGYRQKRKTFLKNQALQSESYSHEGLQDFKFSNKPHKNSVKCPICGKFISSKGNLSRHLKIHDKTSTKKHVNRIKNSKIQNSQRRLSTDVEKAIKSEVESLCVASKEMAVPDELIKIEKVPNSSENFIPQTKSQDKDQNLKSVLQQNLLKKCKMSQDSPQKNSLVQDDRVISNEIFKVLTDDPELPNKDLSAVQESLLENLTSSNPERSTDKTLTTVPFESTTEIQTVTKASECSFISHSEVDDELFVSSNASNLPVSDNSKMNVNSNANLHLTDSQNLNSCEISPISQIISNVSKCHFGGASDKDNKKEIFEDNSLKLLIPENKDTNITINHMGEISELNKINFVQNMVCEHDDDNKTPLKSEYDFNCDKKDLDLCNLETKQDFHKLSDSTSSSCHSDISIKKSEKVTFLSTKEIAVNKELDNSDNFSQEKESCAIVDTSLKNESSIREITGQENESRSSELENILLENESHEIEKVLQDNESFEIEKVLQDNVTFEIEKVLQDNKTFEIEKVLQDNKTFEIEKVLQENESCEIEEDLQQNESCEIEKVLQVNESCEIEKVLQENEENESCEMEEILQENESCKMQEILHENESCEMEETLQESESREIKAVLEENESCKLEEILPENESCEIEQTLEGNASCEMEEILRENVSCEIEKTLEGNTSCEMEEILPENESCEIEKILEGNTSSEVEEILQENESCKKKKIFQENESHDLKQVMQENVSQEINKVLPENESHKIKDFLPENEYCEREEVLQGNVSCKIGKIFQGNESCEIENVLQENKSCELENIVSDSSDFQNMSANEQFGHENTIHKSDSCELENTVPKTLNSLQETQSSELENILAENESYEVYNSSQKNAIRKIANSLQEDESPKDVVLKNTSKSPNNTSKEGCEGNMLNALCKPKTTFQGKEESLQKSKSPEMKNNDQKKELCELTNAVSNPNNIMCRLCQQNLDSMEVLSKHLKDFHDIPMLKKHVSLHSSKEKSTDSHDIKMSPPKLKLGTNDSDSESMSDFDSPQNWAKIVNDPSTQSASKSKNNVTPVQSPIKSVLKKRIDLHILTSTLIESFNQIELSKNNSEAEVLLSREHSESSVTDLSCQKFLPPLNKYRKHSFDDAGSGDSVKDNDDNENFSFHLKNKFFKSDKQKCMSLPDLSSLASCEIDFNSIKTSLMKSICIESPFTEDASLSSINDSIENYKNSCDSSLSSCSSSTQNNAIVPLNEITFNSNFILPSRAGQSVPEISSKKHRKNKLFSKKLIIQRLRKTFRKKKSKSKLFSRKKTRTHKVFRSKTLKKIADVDKFLKTHKQPIVKLVRLKENEYFSNKTTSAISYSKCDQISMEPIVRLEKLPDLSNKNYIKNETVLVNKQFVPNLLQKKDHKSNDVRIPKIVLKKETVFIDEQFVPDLFQQNDNKSIKSNTNSKNSRKSHQNFKRTFSSRVQNLSDESDVIVDKQFVPDMLQQNDHESVSNDTNASDHQTSISSRRRSSRNSRRTFSSKSHDLSVESIEISDDSLGDEDDDSVKILSSDSEPEIFSDSDQNSPARKKRSKPIKIKKEKSEIIPDSSPVTETKKCSNLKTVKKEKNLKKSSSVKKIKECSVVLSRIKTK